MKIKLYVTGPDKCDSNWDITVRISYHGQFRSFFLAYVKRQNRQWKQSSELNSVGLKTPNFPVKTLQKSVFWLFIGSKIFFCITELWMNGISVEKCETPKNRPLNWGFLAGLHPTYTAVLWHGIEKRKKGSLNKFSQAIQKSILIKGFRFSTEGFTRKNSIL